MLAKQELEQKLIYLKPILSQKYHITEIGYFGSFANGTANENSDIDIVIAYDKALGWEFFDIQDLLHEQLNMKVDLVTIKALKKQLKDKILLQTIFV